MNKFTSILAVLMIFTILSCKKSDNTVPDVAPSNLTLTATVSTDNSGIVNFVASATDAVVYTFDYGNSNTAVSATGIVTYRYSYSGVFSVTVTAKSAGGKTAVKTTLVTINVIQGLVWSDEFDTQGSPDPSKWGYDKGAGGWGNNEKEYYTDRIDNSVVSDGTLKIILKKENFSGSAYTSARLLSYGKYSFKYGKIVVRAKLPAGGGTWPAIWMLGNSIFTAGIGWPACGEVDIMEHVGNSPGVIHGSIHTTSSSGNTINTSTKTVSTFNSEFHLYEANWTSDRIEFSIDNQLFYTYAPSVKNSSTWPFDNPCFIILNVAIGGNFGGAIDPAFTSAQMEIDYVRVYQ